MACTTLTVYAFRPLVREYSAGPKTSEYMCVCVCVVGVLALTLTHSRRYYVYYTCVLYALAQRVYSTPQELLLLSKPTERYCLIINVRTVVYRERKIYKENHIIRIEGGIFLLQCPPLCAILFVTVVSLDRSYTRIKI
jgi:hypothetical protein